MNTDITLFQFENQSIRTGIDEHGEPWFVGKDICRALGYVDPTNAIKLHCNGVVKRHPIVIALEARKLRSAAMENSHA